MMNIEAIEKIVKNRKPGAIGKYRYFSVLIPIVEIEDKVYVVYEVRASHMKTRPGEICFPGGHIEENESKRKCAVRETSEELGINKNKIKVIGELDTLHTYSNFTMYAFLGKIEYEDFRKIKINPDEVQEVFIVPLEELINTQPYVYDVDIIPGIGEDFPYSLLGMESYNWQHGSSQVPIYNIDKWIIWGLTARITKSFVEMLKNNLNNE